MKSLNCTRVGLNTMCHVISPSTRLPPRRPLSRTPHPQRGVFLPHNYLLSYFFPPHIAHDAHDDHTDDMPSSSTSTKETVTRQVPWIDHTLRQLKLLVPGAVVTYYLGTVNDFLAVLYGQGGQWGQLAAFAASLLGLTTVSLFIYVLLLPWITGEEPDYQTWRKSGTLSSVIPILTGSMVVGWVLSVTTVGQWTSLGYPKGIIGVSAMYALTFGLLGLLPVGRIRHVKVKQ